MQRRPNANGFLTRDTSSVVITDQIASCAWTDAEVQTLHRPFSVEMSREVRALVALKPLVRASWASP